jgi:DNA topoisomerase-3
MRTVVICEKPSQAANVRAAVGDQFGRVLSAQGHLLRLDEPDEINPDWKRWSNVVLVPPSGRYGYRPDEGGGKAVRLAAIEAALKDADRVIIATDCDREGQAIGSSLIDHCGFKGSVLRAMFTAEDPVSLRQAFETAEPNSKYRPLYDAAVARQQADQISNLTLTRVATNALRPAGWKQAIGIGRVKTPTLGIVCARELEITSFVPMAFFEVGATVVGAAGQVELWHRRRGEARLLDKSVAEAVRAAAAAYHGPLLVAAQHRASVPPKPFDLPSLQKAAGRWGWSAKKTLDVLQALYETHKLTTYPRAETRFLPEALTGQAPLLLDALRAHYPGGAPAEATIRKGKGGVYSDKGLAGASHHAVIPNFNVADRFAALIAGLSPDEAALFDLVARAWLSAISPDYEFDETVMAFTVEVAGVPFEFVATGRVETAPGWKSVYRETEEDAGGDEVAATLPALTDGEVVSVEPACVVAKTTTAPVRYSEGDLIDAMKNAWRFVAEGPDRDRLKEAKGIGTPATRDTVIEGLKAQGLVTVEKSKLRPTELGLWLYGLVASAAGELVDPAATARMECSLDSVLEGGVSIDTVLAEVVARTTALVAKIVAAGEATARPVVKRPPTAKMIDAARAKAKRDGLKRLPKGVLDDFETCRSFLGPLPEKSGDGPRLASDKQVSFIRSLIGKGHAPPSGFPDAVAAETARTWIDAALAAKVTG